MHRTRLAFRNELSSHYWCRFRQFKKKIQSSSGTLYQETNTSPHRAPRQITLGKSHPEKALKDGQSRKDSWDSQNRPIVCRDPSRPGGQQLLRRQPAGCHISATRIELQYTSTQEKQDEMGTGNKIRRYIFRSVIQTRDGVPGLRKKRNLVLELEQQNQNTGQRKL